MSEKADKRKKQISSVGNVADLALSQIIRAAMEKDPAAMAELFERTRRHLYYYAYMLTGNTSDAEDLLQEAYIKCILSLDTLQNPDAFYTWMWTILRNLRANNIRRQKYMVMSSDALAEEENRVLEALIDDTDTPEKRAEKKELAGILRHMIHALPAEQQEVVLLHYYDELTLSEIAKIQDCPLATVKSRLLYAKKSLRTAIRMEEEKCGVALHSTVLIPLYPAILARLSNLISLSADSAFSIFMNVAAFFGVTCSGDTIQLLGTTTTDDHPIRDKAYVIRIRVAPIVAAGMALCVAIGFGAGKAFTKADAVPMETVTVEKDAAPVLEEVTETSNNTEGSGKHIWDERSLVKNPLKADVTAFGADKCEIQVGEALALQYSSLPYSAPMQDVEVLVESPEVATANGKQIIGLSPGTTYIRFMNPYITGFSTPCIQLTVVDATKESEPLTAIEFQTDNLNNLMPGDVFSLNYNLVPYVAAAEEILFTVDDPDILTYDGTVVRAFTAGTTTIRCLRASDNSELGSIELQVYDNIDEIPIVVPYRVKFGFASRIFHAGEAITLMCNIVPGTAMKPSWYWDVSDPSVIAFDGTTVTGISEGESYITIFNYPNDELIAQIKFIILPPKEE